jgi:glutaminase
MGKHCNNSQCFKEKNYKAKFSISSILKKIKSIEIILEKNKKKKKNNIGNTVVIYSVL